MMDRLLACELVQSELNLAITIVYYQVHFIQDESKLILLLIQVPFVRIVNLVGLPPIFFVHFQDSLQVQDLVVNVFVLELNFVTYGAIFTLSLIHI